MPPRFKKPGRPGYTNRAGRMNPVGSAVDGYLSEERILRIGKEKVVALLWPTVVGAWFARRSQVIETKRGVVTVKCDSASVAQELELRSGEIIERLNERLRGPVITEIRPSTGGIRQERAVAALPASVAERAPTEGELALVALSPAEKGRIEAVSAAIEDPALRERYLKVAADALRLDRWKRLQGYTECKRCGVLSKHGPPGYCTACWAQLTPAHREAVLADAENARKKPDKRPKRLGRG
jgi:predicted nucleic acid-binding Zn ribbon protein